MVLLDYDNNYPTYSFLVFKDNTKWYWFENSDFNISRFMNLIQFLVYLVINTKCIWIF